MQHKHYVHYVHTALLRLRNLGPQLALCGICANLECYLQDIFEEKGLDLDADVLARQLMLYTARKWPKHSGCNTYPIPHPDWGRAESTEFEYTDAAHTAYTCLKDDAWDRTKPYGALRYELLNFLIERTKP